VAWAQALEHQGPTALVLTRQNVAFVKRDDETLGHIARGGYVLADFPNEGTRAVVLATGSEVPLALGARERLAAEGIGVRVVSMPCTERFDAQDPAYRRDVLPPGIPRLAVEAGASGGWYKYVGAVDEPHAGVVGIDRFGESAPANALFQHFGLTVDAVADAVRRIVAPHRSAA
jgi:transketolase